MAAYDPAHKLVRAKAQPDLCNLFTSSDAQALEKGSALHRFLDILETHLDKVRGVKGFYLAENMEICTK